MWTEDVHNQFLCGETLRFKYFFVSYSPAKCVCVFVCVGVLLMLWGNMYVFAQSHCGDPSSLWGQNVPKMETTLHFSVKTWFKVWLRLGSGKG